MSKYVNNGSKDGSKGYLVVGGKRVYTGQEFEASDKDIKVLEQGYNIAPKDAPKPKTVEKPKPKTSSRASETKQSKTPEKSKFDYKKSSYRSGDFNYKTTKPDKGVK